MRDGRVTVCADSTTIGLCRVLADGERDCTVGLRRDAFDECNVGARERMTVALFGQGAFCNLIFGEDYAT